MRPNVHTLSCWNVGVGDASVAGDQSSVDVGDGTDASAWNPLPHCHCHSSTLPHCHCHSPLEFRESASPATACNPCQSY